MQYALRLNGGPDLEQIRARLLAVLGPQRDDKRFDPLSQLVFGMLSARTHDHVAATAFRRLRDRYPAWKHLCTAHPREIEPLIRSVTFAEQKANYIPHALRSIVQKRGALELGFLAHLGEEDGMEWLRRLHGVKAKIAATVLNFSTLRKRVLAVDTHLLRVGERLGLLPPGADYEIGYVGYMRLVPNDWDADALYEFHWLMKYLGQYICRHAQPECPRCPLRDLCPSFIRH
jgi:endonuclease-3